MKILVLNCGSSSLKYQLINMETEEVLASGKYERIGEKEAFITHKVNGQKIKIDNPAYNHTEAIEFTLKQLTNPEYKVIEEKNNKSILEVNILTGRRNQIRVHLSENNHPIIGDKKYGSQIKSRLMLHAYILQLTDPRTNKELTIKAKIPKEFEVSKCLK